MEGLVRGKGVVLSRDMNTLVIRMPVDGDENCSSHCKTCGICEKGKNRHIDVVADIDDGTANVHEGDPVAVEYERRDPAGAAALFFLPPLAGLILGGFVATALAGGGDPTFLAGAAGGFVCGGFVTYCLRRKYPGMVRPRASSVSPLDGERR